MNGRDGTNRRRFLESVAFATVPAGSQTPPRPDTAEQSDQTAGSQPQPVEYPRRFSGAALSMISFPLGGVGAGSIGLGGRGQLRDWEIFNRADRGNTPDYAFASIWAKAKSGKPIARVLESRIAPPYEGQDGLGTVNAPGLARLQGATFTGEFPLARIDFHDTHLPVHVALEADTPFIPLDADASGLPVAVLRYRVRNPSATEVEVAIAFSVDNPVRPSERAAKNELEKRQNQFVHGDRISGLRMTNPGLPDNHDFHGSFALAAINTTGTHLTSIKGWPAGRWWDSPLLFWDDFSSDGELGPEAKKVGSVGALSLKRNLGPHEEAEYTFLLAWHFPNRTPERCGWHAPEGYEKTVIGNWYATRFSDAWAAAEYTAANLNTLEVRTRRFAKAMRESMLPPQIKEAATANLSTLVTPTCFRTSDGEFHGFEGIDDHVGCCHGNCTHVWNYETATAHLFPSLSHSLRKHAFGFSMDDRGAIYFRQSLPDGISRTGFVAADGQMGQIIKVYMDWQLSGDKQFLTTFWPKAKKALEFAWAEGSWDANRDGVMEGVQHNTYDVEFYGPNPLCGIYYLGALRAAEEMAKAVGETDSAAEYQRLFLKGREWIDRNLFNGEYYVQQIRPYEASQIANGLRSGMGADDPEHPEYQVGTGCLIDQLLGQYLADVCGLGPLVSPANIHKTLDSIYRYNHKPSLADHNCVERTYALNDEAAVLVCDYGRGERPTIPFPYYAEVWTGLEHATAALMIYAGMADRATESIANIRRRYDGVRRNPWDEAECGHHYARAMASWSSVLAWSGFRYSGSSKHVTALPRSKVSNFRSFWSAGTGWGVFTLAARRFELHVDEGLLRVSKLELPARFAVDARARLGTTDTRAEVKRQNATTVLTWADELSVTPSQPLIVEA